MATIRQMLNEHLCKVTLCVIWRTGYQTRSLFFSDRETIKPALQTHKPADSGLVVGNGARRCRLDDVTVSVVKQS
jgi:hypothetical protein